MKKNKVKIDKTIEAGIINEKNEQLVKVKSFSITKFIIKLFAAAILITFGVLIFVNPQEAQFAVLLITGCVCVIAALVRIIPLLKTLQTSQAKLISSVEILLHLFIGGVLIVSSFSYLNSPEDGFGVIVNNNFNLAIAIILYTRALAYFWITVLYKERTTKFNFWLHIIAITLAVIFAALSKLSPFHIAMALYLIVESGGGYYRYRKAINNAKKKEEEYHKVDEVELPAKDDEKIDEIELPVIPVEEPIGESNIVS